MTFKRNDGRQNTVVYRRKERKKIIYINSMKNIPKIRFYGCIS